MTYEDVKRIRENPDSESPDNKELSKLIDEAVKKQIPKNPISKQDYFGFELVCPSCEKPITNVWSNREYKPKYCHYCGQALDWNHCGGKI